MPARLLAGLALLTCATGVGALSVGSRAQARRIAPAALTGAVSPALTTTVSLQAPPSGRLLVGITEDNANLLYAPALAPPAPAFKQARAELDALRPSYIRLLVNWAAFQPTADRSPALSGVVDGCMRGLSPCGGFDDLAAQLAAIRTRQLSGEVVAPVIALLGTPAWAAASTGCRPDAVREPAAPLSAAGVRSYGELVAAILAVARRAGVALPYLAPWIEPNNAALLAPQRAGCQSAGTLVSTSSYAQLVRAMGAVLGGDSQPHQMLLGELAQATISSTRETSIADFVAALPSDVLCASPIWSVHDYATWGGSSSQSAVSALERALAVRGGCAASARIWVTETGAGGPHPGRRRTGGVAGQRAACRAEAVRLASYLADPRVDAVFQYTLREDPDFPVGLVNATLTYTYPAYALWLAWGERATGLASAPPVPAQCSG